MIEPLLILVCVLAAIAIVLIIILRPRAATDLQPASAKILELQGGLSRIETALREDLRINRQEGTEAANTTRAELNVVMAGFKSELTEAMRAMSELNQRSLEKVSTTVDQRVTVMVDKTETNLKLGREELAKNVKESSEASVLQLDKMNNQVQERLKFLAEQASKDSTQMQEKFGLLIKGFEEAFVKNVSAMNELQKEKFAQLEFKQNELVKTTETRLDVIRGTVEEKLEKTLSERLGHSFETVGKQLIEVQRGLGEMQTLAQDVGGLKRVLSNVKMRGGIGEIQLGMLLEQILAPEQYEANVKVKPGADVVVEFAVKLPGRDDSHTQVWLPIDAKFPKDVYEQLQTAYDAAEPAQIESAQKKLEDTIRKMAKDMRDKYIDPPNTTDFAIMFLPFEGIYGEVVRKASLLEDLQRTYKIIVTGPTTLAAILNSLQLGFRTLAIQKRSSEVWQVLGAVKKEFETFGTLLAKAQNNIQTGMTQLDDVMGKRTRAIQRKLKGVETLTEAEAKLILPTPAQDDADEEQQS